MPIVPLLFESEITDCESVITDCEPVIIDYTESVDNFCAVLFTKRK